MTNYGVPGTKAARTRQVIHELLLEHEADGTIPTNGRFVFYELEQRGNAAKAPPGKKRTVGWPPGPSDVVGALTWLREKELVPWHWLVDESRDLTVWVYAASVREYARHAVWNARINPWGNEPPPLILCESRATAGVLEALTTEYLCPIAGTGGFCRGFLLNRIAPLLQDEDGTVLYLGDLDKSGGEIEAHAREVLSDTFAAWRRVAITPEQAQGITPIWKVDPRDKQRRQAWEVESLGQAEVVRLVRAALDESLPEPLQHVLDRETAERLEVAALLQRDGS